MGVQIQSAKNMFYKTNINGIDWRQKLQQTKARISADW